METPFRWTKSRGVRMLAWQALPAVNYNSRVSLEVSRPGGIRSASDLGVKRKEQVGISVDP